MNLHMKRPKSAKSSTHLQIEGLTMHWTNTRHRYLLHPLPEFLSPLLHLSPLGLWKLAWRTFNEPVECYVSGRPTCARSFFGRIFAYFCLCVDTSTCGYRELIDMKYVFDWTATKNEDFHAAKKL